MRGRMARALCAALLALALAAVPARATVTNHPFIGSLEGKFTPAAEFEDACGVAVDSHGDLYVADYYHHAVDVFDPSRNYLTQIAAVEPSDGPCNLAVDSSGDVYVNSWHRNVVRYAPAQFPPAYASAYGPGTAIDQGGSTGVALDPATGNLYVDDRTYVAEYQPSGAPVLNGEGKPLQIGLGSLGEGYGVAVSGFPATAGRLYVPDAKTGTVKVFDRATSTVNPVGEIDGAGTPQAGFVSLRDSDVAIDPSSGHVFVADDTQPGLEHPAAVVDEFNSAGDYRGQLPHAIVDALPSALAVEGSSGDVYATAGNDEEASVYVFGPGSAAHTLTVAVSGRGQGTVRSEPPGVACGTACAAEYNAEAEVTLVATPAPHSTFLGFSGGGCSGTGRCRVTLEADTEVKAEFEALPQKTLTLTKAGSGAGTVTSAPAGIDCGASCTLLQRPPSSTLFPSPSVDRSPRSRFLGFSGGGCAGAGPCEVTMSEARSLSAEFEAVPQRTLAVEAAGAGKGAVSSEPAGIDCGESCSAEFDEGTEVTLVATPAPHSTFLGFSGGGCSGTGACKVTLGADRTVSATFAPIQHTLSLTETGDGTGTVSSEPAGIDCGAACAHAYVEGTAISLAAVPAPGSRFTGWSGGGCSGTQSCQVTLGADTEVRAGFAVIRHTLAIARVGAGQGVVLGEPNAGIACGVLCSGVYAQGTSLTLIAQPLRGSVFAGWSGCESAAANRCTVTMGEDRTVSASFEAAAPTHPPCRKGFVPRRGKCTKKPKQHHRHRHRKGKRGRR